MHHMIQVFSHDSCITKMGYISLTVYSHILIWQMNDVTDKLQDAHCQIVHCPLQAFNLRILQAFLSITKLLGWNSNTQGPKSTIHWLDATITQCLCFLICLFINNKHKPLFLVWKSGSWEINSENKYSIGLHSCFLVKHFSFLNLLL